MVTCYDDDDDDRRFIKSIQKWHPSGEIHVNLQVYFKYLKNTKILHLTLKLRV